MKSIQQNLLGFLNEPAISPKIRYTYNDCLNYPRQEYFQNEINFLANTENIFFELIFESEVKLTP